MKIKVWLDSGANAYSCYEQVVDLEKDLGVSVADWNASSEDEKEKLMRDVAWRRMDWGWGEL